MVEGGSACPFVPNPNDGDTPGVHDGVPDNIPATDVQWNFISNPGGIDVDFDGLFDYVVENGQARPYDPGIDLGTGYQQQGGDGTPEADLFGGELLPRVKRHVANLIGQIEVSDKVTLFAEGKYANVESLSFGFPHASFLDLFIDPSNPFIPDNLVDIISGNGGALFGRAHFDLGRPGTDVDRETILYVLGAEGDLSESLNYELSYVFGQTKVRNRYVNNIYADRFNAAFDAVSGAAVSPTAGLTWTRTLRLSQPSSRANVCRSTCLGRRRGFASGARLHPR